MSDRRPGTKRPARSYVSELEKATLDCLIANMSPGLMDAINRLLQAGCPPLEALPNLVKMIRKQTGGQASFTELMVREYLERCARGAAGPKIPSAASSAPDALKGGD